LTIEAFAAHTLRAPISRPLSDEPPVPWPRLVEQLQRGLGHRLILISAPPGSGKTWLARRWASECGLPVAWLPLTADGAALHAFVRNLAAALSQIFPTALAQASALLRSAEPPAYPVLLATLLNDLDSLPESFVLILDGYHFCQSPALDELWTAVLRHPPRPLHLVICTRQDPDLPVADLRARGNITEVRALDLQLTDAEVAAYLRRRAGVGAPDETCDAIARETEGWLAGVDLAAPAMAGEPALMGILWSTEAQRALEDLFDGVLRRQPATTQDFLIHTALLDRLHGPLCEAITGLHGPPCDGQSCLVDLERSNAFTVPLDDGQRWFRYHRLFREFLQRRLNATHSPAAIARLHARAGDWYAEHGSVAEAVPHLLAARSERAVVRLIDARRHDVMEREDWPELDRWLGMLPRPVIDAHPELLMLEAWTLGHHARMADAMACLDRIEALPAEVPALHGEMAALRAECLDWAGNGEAGLAAAQRGLALTPFALSGVRGRAWASAADARLLLGQRQDAFAGLDEAQQEDQPGHGAYPARLYLALCSLYWTAGDLRALLQTAGQMHRLAGESGLPESLAWATYFQGCAYYQQNDLPAAEKCFAATVARPEAAHGFAYAQAACGLAAVYHFEGRDDRALAMVAGLSNHAGETGNAGLAAEAQALRAYLATSMGQKLDAENWARMNEGALGPVPATAFHAPQITLARILAGMHTTAGTQRARALLATLHDGMAATNNTRFLSEVLALQALMLDAQDDAPGATACLKRALDLARPGGLFRVFVDLGPRMAQLIERIAASEPDGSYCSQIIQAYRKPAEAGIVANQDSLIEPLSDRELEVLALLGQRLSNKEIGRELGISSQTVKRHTMNIYQKLLVQSRREAVARGTALGILGTGPRQASRAPQE
jgi:LuxR family transcriptional regulator, maltose regulon positive regulatory protein